jgi:hypothetical protein
VTQTQYGVAVTRIIDERTGGFDYPPSFESDVAACFLRRLAPEQAAAELLAEYARAE